MTSTTTSWTGVSPSFRVGVSFTAMLLCLILNWVLNLLSQAGIIHYSQLHDTQPLNSPITHGTPLEIFWKPPELRAPCSQGTKRWSPTMSIIKRFHRIYFFVLEQAKLQQLKEANIMGWLPFL